MPQLTDVNLIFPLVSTSSHLKDSKTALNWFKHKEIRGPQRAQLFMFKKIMDLVQAIIVSLRGLKID